MLLESMTNMKKSLLRLFSLARFRKTPYKKTGYFPCKDRLEAELTSLIFSLSSLEHMEDETELLVYTDLDCIKKFIDCHVYMWELAGWEMENGQAPTHVKLWEKLSDIFMNFDVDLIYVDDNNDKFTKITDFIEILYKNKKGAI